MGGDGGISYALKEMNIHKIPIEQLQFAALPFGSGCDLAQVCGWGKVANEKHLHSIH